MASKKNQKKLIEYLSKQNIQLPAIIQTQIKIKTKQKNGK